MELADTRHSGMRLVGVENLPNEITRVATSNLVDCIGYRNVVAIFSGNSPLASDAAIQ